MNIFERYPHLWPTQSAETLSPLLSQVQAIEYPLEADLIAKIKNPQKTVIVIEKASLTELTQILSHGFEHLIQKNRKDFGQELLASALMVLRPEAFSKSPLAFFLNGFQSPEKSQVTEKSIVLELANSSDKSYLLQRLYLFLEQSENLKSLKDLCIQVADELLANAIFSAPTRSNGEKLYQSLNRATLVSLPENKKVKFFSFFSDFRVVVGCEDSYGSLQKHILMDHFDRVFTSEKPKPLQSLGGAGLGFKYMIENSANFYAYVEPGKKTIVACGFLLSGMKANMSPEKHMHLSFR